jgi:sugar transferase (PEP-CTERM/EpsH1 system associated)
VKILYVVPYVPSLVRVRPYNLIRHLAARGHEISLVTIWTNAREREELTQLESSCSEIRAVFLPAWRSLGNCVAALAGGEPLQARYSWSREIERHVRELSAGVDVVHVEHLRGARYASAAASSPHAPVVWDSVDCISHLFGQSVSGRRDRLGRIINQLELSRTRRAEGRLAGAFDRVLVTSEIDKAALLRLAGGQGDSRHIDVLANGVDLDYFTPANDRRDPDTLVFSGKMSYHANESAVMHLVRDVMPRVWAARPSARLVVVGKDPSRRLQAALTPHGERVVLTGTVPDMRPYLRQAAAAVVPLVYGAGCQNKVLEAMACGTPVVATAQAVSALSVEPGREVLVADGPEPFAGAVIGLLADPGARARIGRAGRRYVEAHHRWHQIAARLESIYNGVAAARRHALAAGARTAQPVRSMVGELQA